MLGEGGEYGTAQPEHVLEGYTIGTEEGLKTGTIHNRECSSKDHYYTDWKFILYLLVILIEVEK